MGIPVLVRQICWSSTQGLHFTNINDLFIEKLCFSSVSSTHGWCLGSKTALNVHSNFHRTQLFLYNIWSIKSSNGFKRKPHWMQWFWGLAWYLFEFYCLNVICSTAHCSNVVDLCLGFHLWPLAFRHCRVSSLCTSFLYTAKTLRDSQTFPPGDSFRSQAKQRQPSGFPQSLLSQIKQSNTQHETCRAGTSSAYCSLLRKSWTGYNDYSGSLSLQTRLKWHCAVCRLSLTHLAAPAETGTYIFRCRGSVLLIFTTAF